MSKEPNHNPLSAHDAQCFLTLYFTGIGWTMSASSMMAVVTAGNGTRERYWQYLRGF